MARRRLTAEPNPWADVRLIPDAPLSDATELAFVGGRVFVNAAKHELVVNRHVERAAKLRAATDRHAARAAKLRAAIEVAERMLAEGHHDDASSHALLLDWLRTTLTADDAGI